MAKKINKPFTSTACGGLWWFIRGAAALLALAFFASCSSSKKIAALEQRQTALASRFNEAQAVADSLTIVRDSLLAELAERTAEQGRLIARRDSLLDILAASAIDTETTAKAAPAPNPLSGKNLATHFQDGRRVFVTWKGKTRPCENFGFSHPDPQRTGFKFFAKTVPFKEDEWHMKLSWEGDQFYLRTYTDATEKTLETKIKVVSHNLDSTSEPFKLVLNDGSVVTFSRK